MNNEEFEKLVEKLEEILNDETGCFYEDCKDLAKETFDLINIFGMDL